MNKSFKCEECPRRFDREDDLHRHVERVHDDRKPDRRARSLGFRLERPEVIARAFECPVCPQRFSSSTALRGHTRLHKYAKGFECTVCHVKCTTAIGLSTHMSHRHSDRPKTCDKRKRSASASLAGQTPAKRVKDEPASAEDLNHGDVSDLLGVIEGMEGGNEVPNEEPGDAEVRPAYEPDEENGRARMSHRHPGNAGTDEERKRSASITPDQAPPTRVKEEPTSAEDLSEEDVNELLGVIENMKGGNEAPKQQPERAEDGQEPNIEQAVKAEAPDFEDTHAAVPRVGVSVQLKTSTGRILVAENQPASMTYGDFRKLFGIPAKGSKRTIFKKTAAENVYSSDNWVVAVDDGMKLPLVDGCIVAEICADF